MSSSHSWKRPSSSSSASWSSQAWTSIQSRGSVASSVVMQHQLQPAPVEGAGVVLRVLARIDLPRPREIGRRLAAEALQVQEVETLGDRGATIAGDVHPVLGVVLLEDPGSAEGDDVVAPGALLPARTGVLFDQAPREDLGAVRPSGLPELHVEVGNDLSLQAGRGEHKGQVGEERAVAV